MKRIERIHPLPNQMQGLWVSNDKTKLELLIEVGEVICSGETIQYDYKEIIESQSAVSVNLYIEDETKLDSFTRENFTGFVITPEGKFYAYNVKTGVHFVQN